MARAVLDTSALLAFVNGEPGAESVANLIGDALVCSVNWAETLTKLTDRGGSLERARGVFAEVSLDVVDFTRQLAEDAAGLIRQTKPKGLSLGDRACLALAGREQLPAVTADRVWAELPLDVEIQLIR
jgi:PIN domain nuclease of toxin-antitoxin system